MRSHTRRTKKLRSLIYKYIARAEERKQKGDRRGSKYDQLKSDQLMDRLRKFGM